LDHDNSLQNVAQQLQLIGLAATVRLKTSQTIIDKLRRDRASDLRTIQDLAGARIVRPMTLDQQDAVRDQIVRIWPNARVVDRRENPSSGYRAIHIIPIQDGCPVEIQLRTHYQDVWAQTMERFGDIWGRAIRYGGEPDDPQNTDGHAGGVTRAETIGRLIEFGDDLHKLAEVENGLARLRALDSDGEKSKEIDELEIRVDEAFKQHRETYETLRNAL
jgi:hypothetical protein